MRVVWALGPHALDSICELLLRETSPPSLHMLIEAAKVLGVFVVLGFRAKVLWL